MAAAAATNSASEVEETLARIRSHNGVEGVIIMNREGELARKLQPRVWRVLVSYRAARVVLVLSVPLMFVTTKLPSLFLSNNTDTTTHHRGNTANDAVGGADGGARGDAVAADVEGVQPRARSGPDGRVEHAAGAESEPGDHDRAGQGVHTDCDTEPSYWGVVMICSWIWIWGLFEWAVVRVVAVMDDTST